MTQKKFPRTFFYFPGFAISFTIKINSSHIMPAIDRHAEDVQVLEVCLLRIIQGRRASPLKNWVFPGKDTLPFEEAFDSEMLFVCLCFYKFLPFS